jgi:putative DNA primase/helicase
VPSIENLPELPESWVERFAVGRGAGKAGRLASSTTTSMEHSEAARWLGEHGSGQPCRAVRGVLRKALDDLDAAVETGAARYDVAVAGSMALILLAHEGHRGARPALKVLRDAYFEAVGDARDTADEWRRMVTEGISKAAALPEGATEAHEEGACPDREDGRFWPPPTAPYDVAARWVADRHTHTDGRTTLAHWRSDFYRWSGARWELHPESTISAELYRELAGASYWSAAQVPVELPWRPDAGKVRKVLDALAAFCHRPDGAEPDEGRGEIALADGVLDVASGELRPHCPSRFNLTALPFAQPSRADGCAAWLAFLADVFGEDAESIELLRQWFGYVVSGRTELQKIMFLLGPPRSGKGVITRTLERLVGPEARVAPTMDSLTTNFGLQPVIGRSLAVITDARFGGRNGSVVVERLLTVSGGDTLTIDRKNREPWTGRPIARWMIVTNELPGISDASGALARRVLGPLETVASLSDAEIDPHLERTISAELPGVLAWALEGLRSLDALDGVFTVPKVARATRREMTETFSPITAFLAECCALDAEGADGSLSCEATALYAVYRRWSEDSGQHAVSSLRFGRELKAALQGRIERTRTRRPDRSQVYVYRGIAPIPRARHDAVL